MPVLLRSRHGEADAYLRRRGHREKLRGLAGSLKAAGDLNARRQQRSPVTAHRVPASWPSLSSPLLFVAVVDGPSCAHGNKTLRHLLVRRERALAADHAQQLHA